MSTKTLLLMKFVARARACPTQIETFAESGYCALPSAVASVAPAHDLIELCSEQGAHRKTLFDRQWAGFAQAIGIEFPCDIRFHGWHGFTCRDLVWQALGGQWCGAERHGREIQNLPTLPNKLNREG